jgi:hypothetical protein
MKDALCSSVVTSTVTMFRLDAGGCKEMAGCGGARLTRGDVMGVDELAPLSGDVGHLGIGGKLIAGGPMAAGVDAGGVGVAFCSSMRIRPSLFWLMSDIRGRSVGPSGALVTQRWS